MSCLGHMLPVEISVSQNGSVLLTGWQDLSHSGRGLNDMTATCVQSRDCDPSTHWKKCQQNAIKEASERRLRGGPLILCSI